MSTGRRTKPGDVTSTWSSLSHDELEGTLLRPRLVVKSNARLQCSGIRPSALLERSFPRNIASSRRLTDSLVPSNSFNMDEEATLA